MRTMPSQEVEIKLRVPHARALRLRLKRLGARQTIPRTYESNTLYDTPSRNLTRKGQLLRIRIEQLTADGSKLGTTRSNAALLTYKGPSKSFPGARFKIREEIELALESGEKMSRLLRAVGLRPVFHYEKFRTTFALPGISNLKIEFDETPIGLFLELEGKAADIDRAAGRLGYSKSEYLTSTYGDLYIADCKRRGRKSSNMLFQTTRKSR